MRKHWQWVGSTSNFALLQLSGSHKAEHVSHYLYLTKSDSDVCAADVDERCLDSSTADIPAVFMNSHDTEMKLADNIDEQDDWWQKKITRTMTVLEVTVRLYKYDWLQLQEMWQTG